MKISELHPWISDGNREVTTVETKVEVQHPLATQAASRSRGLDGGNFEPFH